MSKKEKQVNVSLSGKDLEIFEYLKKRHLIEKEAELLRICMRFYNLNYDTIDVLFKAGIDLDKPVEDFRKELDEIKDRLEKMSKA